MTAPSIRDLEAGDEADWRRLWAGYLAFYGTDVPEAVTAATWRRLLDPAVAMFGRLAVVDGAATGFALAVLHPATWTERPTCYLEDLYVDAALRGPGVGRALIDDLLALARADGWSRLYWHTDRGNARARRLYDRYAPADDFVRYRLFLD